MPDFERLRGPDISRQLANPRGFGVAAGRAPDGIPTIELTTDPAVHGPHGRVSVTCSTVEIPVCGDGGCDTMLPASRPAHARSLSAELRVPNAGWARCQSDDSIRIWGRFPLDAELRVGSEHEVRLVARTPSGEILAGPVIVSADQAPTSLDW